MRMWIQTVASPHGEIVVTSEWTGRQPERAALPLAGIHAHGVLTRPLLPWFCYWQHLQDFRLLS